MSFVIQAEPLSIPEVVDFYQEFFSIMSNGKIGTNKMLAALTNEQKREAIWPGQTEHPVSWLKDAGP